jgi:hypothetical protein
MLNIPLQHSLVTCYSSSKNVRILEIESLKFQIGENCHSLVVSKQNSEIIIDSCRHANHSACCKSKWKHKLTLL